MTLPLTGPLGLDVVNTEMGRPANNAVEFNDASVRNMASKPTGMIAASDLLGKTYSAPAALLYVGVSAAGAATPAVIQALPSFAVPTLPWRFNVTAGVNQYMYWAAPKSLGAIQFYDTESFFVGGWDGAHDDWGATVGPVKLVINSVEYLVYRTDYPNLGYVPWEARADASPGYPIP